MGDRSVALNRLLIGAMLMAGAVAANASETEEADERGEPSALASLAHEANRQGLTLSLHAANGKTARFISKHPAPSADPTSYQDFRLRGLAASARFFVVAERRYEGRSLHWVSRASGQRTEVYDSPQLSPDGKWAVTALDWEAYGPSGVFIWSLVDQGLKAEAHLMHGDYGLFTFVRWIGNTSAELELFSHSFTNFCKPGTQSTTARVRLQLRQRVWELHLPTKARRAM